jgi:lysophospholipase L1-like esterase
MKVLLAFILLCIPASYGLQPNSVLVEGQQTSYSFLHLSANKVQHSSTSTFSEIYPLLDEAFAGKRTFNILHMGGSHVQAGAIGFHFRRMLSEIEWNIANERGYLFPYRAAGTNSTQNTRSEVTGEWKSFRCANNKESAHWGMGGMSLQSTTDSSTLKIWTWKPDSSAYRAHEVRLFYRLNEASFEPEWIGSALPVTFRTDSALGCKSWWFNEPVDTLQWRFVQKASNQTGIEIQGCQMLRNEPGITYNEIGVNGASTASYLRCVDFERQLPAITPDLMIFGIGINDAHVPPSDFSKNAYIARYDSLISAIRRVNPKCQVLFLTNNDSYYKKRHPNKNAFAVREAMFELANKWQGAVWDLFEIMGGLNAIQEWEQAGLARKDYIHLTRAGYYLQSELLFQALMKDYGSYLRQQKAGMRKTTNSAD